MLSEVLGGFPKICVKDVWALMTCEAASAYLAPEWLAVQRDGAKQSKPKRMNYPECRLGCTLRRANVTTWTVPLKRVIVRAWHGATHVPNSTARLSTLFPQEYTLSGPCCWFILKSGATRAMSDSWYVDTL